MDVKVIRGAIQESDADAIIVSLFQDAEPSGAAGAVDAALGGAIKELIEGGDFSGKAGQVAVLYPRGAMPTRRVILVGLGKQDEFNVEAARRAAANAIKRARDLKVKRAATILHGAGAGGLDVETAAQAVTEASLLALYAFRGLKKEKEGESEALPQTLELVVFDEADLPAAQRGLDAGVVIASGVAVTRELVDQPPNICTPAYLAEIATHVGEEVGLRVQVLERGQMEALGMGALLAVARGSDSPPRFIILEHNSQRAEELDSIVLVGKGVTFDTGGYNLKSQMGSMKGDMAGAAAVIGAMRAIALLNVPLHVVGLAPAADNMISGHAYRAQEVVTASNGVSIEVVNTDAEGRLLLADALVFAGRFQPAAVVDIATLTGACVQALGGVAAGLFSSDDTLRDKLLAAADATAEKVWPMPLFPEYDKRIESEVADIINSGGPGSGVGTAAIFLKHFISYPAWAHLDMAGMEFDAKDIPYVPKGATGYGVRLLTEFVRRWAG